MTVKDIVVFLDKLGMWDVILPFVLVFTIVFAVLEKTKVLGEEAGEPKHRFNAIAAFVIGAFTLLAVDVLNLVTRFSQYIVIILVMTVCLVVLVSFFGFKDMGSTKLGKRVILPVLFIILVIGMLYAFGWLNVLNWSAVSNYIGLLIGLAVFLLVIWIILREPKKTTATTQTGTTTRPAPAAPTPAPTAPIAPTAPTGDNIDWDSTIKTLPPEIQEEYNRMSEEEKANVKAQLLRQAQQRQM
ncbi:hypothetical protein KY333_03170 [Candidatus Woesearchaeota archaeon]|nr:hypothetical protein [Candidatus Woesearchaeota archaeon]MBW2994340.1 hypothetical protein [Candidatus Woesearchaeota archaeon]